MLTSTQQLINSQQVLPVPYLAHCSFSDTSAGGSSRPESPVGSPGLFKSDKGVSIFSSQNIPVASSGINKSMAYTDVQVLNTDMPTRQEYEISFDQFLDREEFESLVKIEDSFHKEEEHQASLSEKKALMDDSSQALASLETDFTHFFEPELFREEEESPF